MFYFFYYTPLLHILLHSVVLLLYYSIYLYKSLYNDLYFIVIKHFISPSPPKTHTHTQTDTLTHLVLWFCSTYDYKCDSSVLFTLCVHLCVAVIEVLV